MGEIRVESVRNIALVSNVGAGKTSLTEALLYASGAIPTLGSVLQGTTVSDFEPEELHHHCSASTSLLQFTWNQTAITLVDSPGALSLSGESLSALRAVDAVIIVLNPGAGVRTELARLWHRVRELDLPCLVFVNGLDKEGASFDAALDLCKTQLECVPIPMVLPARSGSGCDSVIDLLDETLIRSGCSSPKVERAAVPPEMEQAVKHARKQLIEAVAERDEGLLNRYLEQGDLSRDQLVEGLRSDILTRQFLPVYAGSALRNVGVWSLLNACVSLLPSPAERTAIHPVPGIHPETGQPCLPTLGFTAMMLRPGEQVRPPLRSASAVFHVISGRGVSTVDGRRHAWGPRDTFSAPVFAEIAHEAVGGPAFLMRIHDAPLQEKLGFYEERAP